jgi:hypothetical protein
MTQWGMLLLCVYIALGASGRLTWRVAGRLALALTALVITVAFISYTNGGTPTDKYYPTVDSTIYATGQQTLPSPGQNASTEDTAGVQAANASNTVNPPTNGSRLGGGY